jgi:ADP-ribose pyrophosphatase
MGAVESGERFCNSIGLLVKARRLGLRIGEVRALRLERKQGTSRFRVLKWLLAYLRWCSMPSQRLGCGARGNGHSQSLSLSGAHPMVEEWPKIRSRRTTKISPWMDVIAREVEFAPGEPPQIYHAVGQLDYLAVVARTPDSRVPIVRQYRPAFEAFTWELPAGLIERGEDPAQACARELLEETGYQVRAVHPLGVPLAACTGRLSNRIHSFFVETAERAAGFIPEPGITVALKTPAELAAMITANEFVQQLHLGALLLADLRKFMTLPR